MGYLTLRTYTALLSKGRFPRTIFASLLAHTCCLTPRTSKLLHRARIILHLVDQLTSHTLIILICSSTQMAEKSRVLVLLPAFCVHIKPIPSHAASWSICLPSTHAAKPNGCSENHAHNFQLPADLSSFLLGLCHGAVSFTGGRDCCMGLHNTIACCWRFAMGTGGSDWSESWSGRLYWGQTLRCFLSNLKQVAHK